MKCCDRPDFDDPKKTTLAEVELQAADTDALLRAAYALTHRMHAARKDPMFENDLRVQRNLIDNEIKRRIG